MTDVDTTAADMLVELDSWLNARGVSLAFAEVKDPVREKIQRYELERTIDPGALLPDPRRGGRGLHGRRPARPGRAHTDPRRSDHDRDCPPRAPARTRRQQAAAWLAYLPWPRQSVYLVVVTIRRWDVLLAGLASLAVLVVAAWFAVSRRGTPRVVALVVASGRPRALRRGHGGERAACGSSSWGCSWPRSRRRAPGSRSASRQPADPSQAVRGLPPAPRGAHHEPVVRRREGGAVRARAPLPRAGHRAHRARTGARTCWRWPRMPSPGVPTSSAWPAATARRRSWPRWRAGTASRWWSSRRAPATTSPSTSGWTAPTSSAPSTPSTTASTGGSTSRRSTAAPSSTTRRWASTRRIVQSAEYRDAKLRTAADTLPDLIGPAAVPLDLRFTLPSGEQVTSANLVLVSNNPYQLSHLRGAAPRGRASTPARSGSCRCSCAVRRMPRSSPRSRPPARSVGSPAGTSGPTTEFEVDLRRTRSRSASTARPSPWSRRCASSIRPGALTVRQAAGRAVAPQWPHPPCTWRRPRPCGALWQHRPGPPRGDGMSGDRGEPRSGRSRRPSRCSRSRSAWLGGSSERGRRRAPGRRAHVADCSTGWVATTAPAYVAVARHVDPGARHPAPPAVALREPLQAVVPRRRRARGCSAARPAGAPRRPGSRRSGRPRSS